MKDWDVEVFFVDWGDEHEHPFGAIPAAKKAAATPVTSAMLDIYSRDMEVPFSGSPKTMARLLDIAILTGNQKAAVNLSKKCQLRPLRRWAINWDERSLNVGNGQGCKAARTALLAGADFQDLMVKFIGSISEDVPFPQALFLRSKLEDWQEIRHLLPGCHDLWRPRNLDNRFGKFFLEHPQGPFDGWKLCVGKIRAAEDAGVDMRFCCVPVFEGDDFDICALVTLLDVAIWCGQPDCAEACVDGGIELKDDDGPLAWHQRALRGENVSLSLLGLYGVPSEAQITAAVAGCAWLKRSWKSESSKKGIALFQMMLKMFKGRSFPTALVQEILSFSMPVPKIIDQLDLWEHVSDWMTTICGRPASVHPAADCNTASVEEPEEMQDTGEAGTLLYIEVFVLFSFVCFQGPILGPR